MATKITIEFDDAKTIAKNHGLTPGGSAQKFFTNELLRVSDKYTPMEVGVLKNSATIALDGTFIQYNTPYARYHWYGKLMVDQNTGSSYAPKDTQKVLTTKDMTYYEPGSSVPSPLRGSYWVQRAYNDNKDTLLDSLEKFINGND
ncbi:MAG: minor capsid protein [Erysipelotrichaceae bacterium]|nr:minor capsid protein [Erysipelotrichaceae bacterium]